MHCLLVSMSLGMVSPDLCRNSVWIRVKGSYLLYWNSIILHILSEVVQLVFPPPPFFFFGVVGVGEGPRRLGEETGDSHRCWFCMCNVLPFLSRLGAEYISPVVPSFLSFQQTLANNLKYPISL